MNTRKFKPGPWDNEPDREQWTDSETGLECLVVRHDSLGHLCGYVGLPDGHPNYFKDYDCIDAECHGGLTFSGLGDGVRLPSGKWWIGFDCAHCCDIAPYMSDDPPSDYAAYRTFEYVKGETIQLAKQMSLQSA